MLILVPFLIFFPNIEEAEELRPLPLSFFHLILTHYPALPTAFSTLLCSEEHLVLTGKYLYTIFILAQNNANRRVFIRKFYFSIIIINIHLSNILIL